MRTQSTDERPVPPPAAPEKEDAGATEASRRSFWSRFALRNWRVRWRLVALIIIPTLVAVGLGGLRIRDSLSRADEYGKIEQLAKLGSEITGMVHSLNAERDLTALDVAGDQSRQDQIAQRRNAVNESAKKVRSLASKIDSSYEDTTRERARTVLTRLGELNYLRSIAANGQVPARIVVTKYGALASDLLSFNDVISQGRGDTDLDESVQALTALSRAQEQASRMRGLLAAVLATGSITPGELEDLQAAKARQESEVASFLTAARTPQLRRYQDTVTGPVIDQSQDLLLRALRKADERPRKMDIIPNGGNDAQTWFDSMTSSPEGPGMVDGMRSVEESLNREIIGHSGDHKSQAERSMIIDSAMVAGVLALVLFLTLIVARSLVRPLRRLRAGALDVAGNRLPGLVRRLRDPEMAATRFEVEPIDVASTDEIGEVARSFDEVHKEAVRLASNEAMLRGSVNAMFVNLSRRSQSLIERQLQLIDELERGEQDAERLSNLFKLDHLATRMRRNSENLLVLGGQEQARRWDKPVPLVDVVRASLSEVEQYGRVGLRVQADVSVVGQVVSDLVHLVAELVENATTFSPEHTKVTVSGHLLSGGGAMLQISDNGVGMPAPELDDANWRLANPPVIDVSVSRRMGLFVVGRLAARHGIRVELRSALSGGITAFAVLPAGIITTGHDSTGPQAVGGKEKRAITAEAGHLPEPRSAREPARPAIAAAAPHAAPVPTADAPARRETSDPLRQDSPLPSRQGTPAPVTARHESPSPGTPTTGASSTASTGPIPVAGSAAPSSRGSAGQQGRPATPSQGTAQPVSARHDSPASSGGSLSGGSVSSGSASRGPLSGPPGRPTSPSPRTPSPTPPPAPSRPSPSSPMSRRRDTRGEDRLPIFDAIESEWFQRRSRGPAEPSLPAAPASHSGGTPPPPRGTPSAPAPSTPPTGTPAPSRPAPERPQPGRAAPGRSAPAAPPAAASRRGWESAGDEGWRAAEAASKPATGGVTASGLPRRVPGRNVVPGSAESTRQRPPQAQPPPPPDKLRNRFASYQEGVRRARTTRADEEEDR